MHDKSPAMYSWSTTTEWIAFQFHNKYTESLNPIELDIVNRLIDEGYLEKHISISETDGAKGFKLMFIHSSN